MRNRLTNYLQIIVILTGIVYILTGLIFAISPIRFVNFFSIEITEEWLKAAQYDTFIIPLYFLARCFSIMIMTFGLAMILPLYDPLKYRGLIYFSGVVYPVLSLIFLLFNGLKYDNWILIIYGLVSAGILILNLSALILTQAKAKAGIE